MSNVRYPTCFPSSENEGMLEGIKASLLKKIAIPIPTISAQKSIAEDAESLEQESKRLEAIYQHKLAALAELKQSLLQKAFSGELTADKAEAKVQGAVA